MARFAGKAAWPRKEIEMNQTLRKEELERHYKQFPWNRHPERPLEQVSDAVKRKVFGQDEHVDRILHFIYFAQERIKRINEGYEPRLLPQLNSMLLLGPTASGKTHVVKSIAHEMDMVFYPIDSSTLTGEGWRGRGLSSEWANISRIQEEDQDSIVLVFLDEIDKLTLEDKDYDSFSPKFELLKPLEGGLLRGEGPNRESYEMNCDRCVFIFAGAFTGIEEMVSERLNNSAKAIDLFSAETRKYDYSALDEERLRAMVSLEDVEAWGFPRELVGRFSFVDYMSALKDVDLKRVLFEDLLPRYQSMFKNGGIDLTEAAADSMVSRALLHRYGARNLNQQLSALLIGSSGSANACSCVGNVRIDVSDDGSLACRNLPGNTVQGDDALELSMAARIQAECHARSIAGEIADNRNEVFEPFDGIPSRFEAMLLSRTENLLGDYTNQELLLLRSCLCYIRDWTSDGELSLASLSILLEFCDSYGVTDGHSVWVLDECMQEIHSGLKRCFRRNEKGELEERITLTSMVRHAKNDPPRGVIPAERNGLRPEDDETLGTYCDFKTYSTSEQKEAASSLSRRVSLAG